MNRIVNSRMMLAAGVAAMLLLGGCEKKAGGQVVAVVNGQEITQQELNAELGNAQIPPGADKQVMAQLLQRVIDRKLVVGKAAADGLDQSPPYLAQVRRAQDEILVSMLAQKLAKSQPLPDAGAADKFIASNPTLFGGRKRYALDQIVFPATKDAALVAKLRASHTMDAVEEALKSSGVQYSKGSNTLDTATIAGELGSRLAALPPGEPFLVPQGSQYVVSVIRAAQDAATPTAQAKPAATELLRRQAVAAAMTKIVTDERAKAKIDYQPGFAPPPAAKASAPAAL